MPPTHAHDDAVGTWLRPPKLDEVDSFWRETRLGAWWKPQYALELMAVFIVGVGFMHFLYAETAATGGVSGNDSWYHVKMAQILPELGASEEFPWLQRVYFNRINRDFISHHFGFHVLLVPFINVAKMMGGDALAGGRWAMTFFFGVSLTLFQLILMSQRVRCRWLWLALYLLMPAQFFLRHAYVRAIAPALIGMFAVIILMLRRRYFWNGLALALFTQLYLGAVVYGPLMVLCFSVAGLLGERGDRVSWRVVLWALAGWMLGIGAYPYSAGMFEFLQLQIFGTGLDADISVGREWKPYQNTWWVVEHLSPTLIPFFTALVLRIRQGPRLSAGEMAVLLLSLVFGGLMLKSRRFVEYWPPFALLAAALMARPALNRLAEWFDGLWQSKRRERLVISLAGVLILFAVGLVGWLLFISPRVRWPLVAVYWRSWALMLGVYLLVFGRRMSAVDRDEQTAASVWLAAARRSSKVVIGMVFVFIFLGLGDPLWAGVQTKMKPKFNATALNEAMDALKTHSRRGDIVFADDWDIFTVCFYLNHHNYYLVGLDPKFTQDKEPILWERYKIITRGKTPKTYEVPAEYQAYAGTHDTIRVQLEDIRHYFAADFVLVDKDHSAFRRKLDEAEEFCERIYPAKDKKNPDYAVYRIIEAAR